MISTGVPNHLKRSFCSVNPCATFTGIHVLVHNCIYYMYLYCSWLNFWKSGQCKLIVLYAQKGSLIVHENAVTAILNCCFSLHGDMPCLQPASCFNSPAKRQNSPNKRINNILFGKWAKFKYTVVSLVEPSHLSQIFQKTTQLFFFLIMFIYQQKLWVNNLSNDT